MPPDLLTTGGRPPAYAGAPLRWHPTAPVEGPAVVRFRAAIDGSAAHPDVTWWVSASQRLRLWLDGRELAAGPSRADRGEWGVVPVTPGPLDPGRHQLAVEVIHWGRHAGKGQVGGAGFFLFAGADLNWRCQTDTATTPYEPPLARAHRGVHRALGSGETFIAAAYPWGWLDADFDDSAWVIPTAWPEPADNPWGNRPGGLALVPEPLPPLRRTPWPWRSAPPVATTLPPHQTTSWIYDAGIVLNAVPTARWSGGAGAEVRLTWCEAPVHPLTGKGDRNLTANCELPGQEDVLRPDGGAGRTWSPPWIRGFRYLHVQARTAHDPLEWAGVTLERESFPLEPCLRVEVTDPHARPWARLRQVSLDTALACSHETFFDCPAWEQAQFPGDARIQARHHYLLAGEDRLARKAIRDLAAAGVPGGLLRSHAPSAFAQVIATYSLQWIGLLNDFRIYRGEAAFLAPHLPRARAIVEWFLARRRADGLLGRIAEPLFFDWAKGFTAGCAPQGEHGGNLAATALLAECCAALAQLERTAGRAAFAPAWAAEAAHLRAALHLGWEASRGLLADFPGATTFSVHTQVQAVLAGLWPAPTAATILARALAAADVVQPGTLYYRAHLAEAWRRAGQPAAIWQLLPRWFSLLAGTGLTTWPESDGAQTRSDCHGWGVMPDIELVHAILGCSPDPCTNGWARLVFAPAPGDLTHVQGDIPHPCGPLHVSLRRDEDGHLVDLTTPVETDVAATQTTLPAGTHRFHLPDTRP